MTSPNHLIGNSDRLQRAPGLNLARLLRGAWRSEVQSPKSKVQSPGPETADYLSEAELTEITPQLCQSGAGALAWHKIRNTCLATTAAGRELQEVYRRFRLSALLHEREIAYVFSLLRAAGIEAVLVKGWAIARRYPDRALRPYGDLDLCVAPAQFAEASQVLKRVESIEGPFVDLHCGFDRIGKVQSPTSKVQRPSPLRRLWTLHFGLGTNGDDWDEVFARTLVVECCGEPVRILCDEDHLRILCLHLLRSGARRPAWLCDVALLLELVQSPKSKVQRPSDRVDPTSKVAGNVSTDRHWTLDVGPWTAFGTLDSSFNWEVCLGRDRVQANWVGSTIKLAHELLGANIPEEVQSPKSKVQSPEQLPRWFVSAVLQQWGRKVQIPDSKFQIPKSRVQSPSRSPTVREGSSRTPEAMSNTQRRGALPNRRASAWRHWTLDIGHWTAFVGLWTDLYRRWNNPIRATAAVGGRFNSWPRLPYRVAESIMRLPELPQHLRVLLRRKPKVREQRSEFPDLQLLTSDL